ncbi:TnsA-like heteromeric transposase endonuclease subunit [soil metagenome]
MAAMKSFSNNVEPDSIAYLCSSGDDAAVREIPIRQATGNLFRELMPWRTFRWHYGQRHYSGTYWSSTMSAHVIYESRLELARLMLADFDRSVNYIVAQPFLMRARVDGKLRHHIPDYLLLAEGGPVVVDVKPAHLLDDTLVATTFQWVRTVVAAVGWSFEVASEQPRVMMENVRFLAGSRRRTSVNDSALRQLRTQDLDGMSVGEAILGTRCAESLIRAALLHMLWTHEVNTDLSVVLSSKSILTVPSSL